MTEGILYLICHCVTAVVAFWIKISHKSILLKIKGAEIKPVWFCDCLQKCWMLDHRDVEDVLFKAKCFHIVLPGSCGGGPAGEPAGQGAAV